MNGDKKLSSTSHVMTAVPWERRTTAGEPLRQRLDILHAAHAYALGPVPERDAALDKLVFLSHIAQQEANK